MKNIAITLVGILMVSMSLASTPSNGYKKFYRQYSDAPHTITFKIPGGLANFLINEEDDEVKEFMKNIDDISFFIAEKASKEMIIDLNRHLPEIEYKEMMIVREGKDEVIFLVKDEDGTIKEIIMTVVGEEELIVMAIFGEFTKEDAKKFVKAVKTNDAINFRM